VKEGFLSHKKARMLPFVVTTSHLSKADELKDPRMHAPSGFSFCLRGFFNASTILLAFAFLEGLFWIATA